MNPLLQKLNEQLDLELLDELQKKYTKKKQSHGIVDQDWLTIQDVANILNKHYETIRLMVKANKIKSAKLPGSNRRYIKVAWLNEAMCFEVPIKQLETITTKKKKNVEIWKKAP